MVWHTHRAPAFRAYVKDLETQIIPVRPERFFGSDHDRNMVEIARRNVRKAGFDEWIGVEEVSVSEARPPTPPSSPYRLVVCNPPYGERMGKGEELEALYREFGHVLRGVFPDSRVGVLAGESSPFRAIGLKSNRRTAMRNGGLRCHLLEYEIFKREPR